jgi:hypothetical protein
MKITLSTSGNIGITVVNKLFDLGYKPQDLEVWCTSEGSNNELVNFFDSVSPHVTGM